MTSVYSFKQYPSGYHGSLKPGHVPLCQKQTTIVPACRYCSVIAVQFVNLLYLYVGQEMCYSRHATCLTAQYDFRYMCSSSNTTCSEVDEKGEIHYWSKSIQYYVLLEIFLQIMEVEEH